MLNQELVQIKELNRQLVDKLQRFEEHEATVLDKHLEYEHIQEGFDKICKNFSETVDPSLGNLSVRGATKKMLLNLQQFAYEQIAMIKVEYTHRIEDMKESFAEEIETLSEAFADTSFKASTFKFEQEVKVEEREKDQDNSKEIIEELQQKLHSESTKADLMTSKFDQAETELKNLKEEHDQLTIKLEKLQEK